MSSQHTFQQDSDYISRIDAEAEYRGGATIREYILARPHLASVVSDLLDHMGAYFQEPTLVLALATDPDDPAHAHLRALIRVDEDVERALDRLDELDEWRATRLDTDEDELVIDVEFV